MTRTEIEHLARYLCNYRRSVDMMLNGQCEPYPLFDDCTSAAQQNWCQLAERVLRGKQTP